MKIIDLNYRYNDYRYRNFTKGIVGLTAKQWKVVTDYMNSLYPADRWIVGNFNLNYACQEFTADQKLRRVLFKNEQDVTAVLLRL
jgi:hypothetical protein